MTILNQFNFADDNNGFVQKCVSAFLVISNDWCLLRDACLSVSAAASLPTRFGRHVHAWRCNTDKRELIKVALHCDSLNWYGHKTTNVHRIVNCVCN